MTHYDRLSNLPDDVIHHIFSYLLVRPNDVVRAMAISKRFRKLAISSPYLSIKLPAYKYYSNHSRKQSCKSIGESLINLMRLRLREGTGSGSPLVTFSLHWYCFCPGYIVCDHPILCTLIDYTAKCGCGTLEELAIFLSPSFLRDEHNRVRLLLSCSTSLRVFKLSSTTVHEIRSTRLFSLFDQAMSVKHITLVKCEIVIDGDGNGDGENNCLIPGCLQTLELDKVVLRYCHQQTHIMKKATISCSLLQRLAMYESYFISPSGSDVIIDGPSLKDLDLCDCLFPQSSEVTIQSESLLSLSVSKCKLTGAFSIPDEVAQFNICAPNVQSLYWTENNYMNINCLKGFSSLQRAKLECPDEFGLDIARALSHLQHTAIRFDVHLQHLKNCHEHQSVGTSSSFKFHQLEHLVVKVKGCMTTLFADRLALESFLRQAPNLKMLSIVIQNSLSPCSMYHISDIPQIDYLRKRSSILTRHAFATIVTSYHVDRRKVNLFYGHVQI